MKNIWFIFGIILITSLFLVIIGIVSFVKKEKFYILINIIIIVIITVIMIDDIPYIKDLIHKETIEVVVVYIDYQSGGGNTDPGARKLFFDYNGEKIELLAPTISQYFVEMEKGKTYKITYFQNCRVIKSYELIE